jgi:hypothetical protein
MQRADRFSRLFELLVEPSRSFQAFIEEDFS